MYYVYDLLVAQENKEDEQRVEASTIIRTIIYNKYILEYIQA
jgi:hypothetical protein